MISDHWQGASWPAEAVAFADHARMAGIVALAPEAHAGAYARLRAIVDGTAEPSGLPDVLDQLSIFWPPHGRTEQPLTAPTPMSTREVARLALDVAPAVGDDAPRLALGPFVDALDLLRPRHVRAWTAAVASAAFLVHGDRKSPAKTWSREGRRPPEEERRRLQVVGRAPPSAWRLVAGEGGLHAVPLLPIASPWLPTGPVDLACVGGVDGGPVDGGLLLGRIVVAGHRAWARAAVVLPACPPAELLQGWFARLALRQLVAERGLDVEELLRRGGHHLWAEAHAWWWGRLGAR